MTVDFGRLAGSLRRERLNSDPHSLIFVHILHHSVQVGCRLSGPLNANTTLHNPQNPFKCGWARTNQSSIHIEVWMSVDEC